MMNRHQNTRISQISPIVAAIMFAASSAVFAQTAPPPTLGQDTKGAPAVQEVTSEASEAGSDKAPNAQAEAEAKTAKNEKSKGGALGTATVKESRRENGQIYLIELEHSLGAKQYIEETDSDGEIQSKANDIDETPNLPKWKLGSW